MVSWTRRSGRQEPTSHCRRTRNCTERTGQRLANIIIYRLLYVNNMQHVVGRRRRRRLRCRAFTVRPYGFGGRQTAFLFFSYYRALAAPDTVIVVRLTHYTIIILYIIPSGR